MTLADKNSHSEAIGDDTLTFELIRLERTNSVGVVRTFCASELGIFEQNFVFADRAEFVCWLEDDEYRHKAPSLFMSVQRTFDRLMDVKGKTSATKLG